jgi:hypothetical protein
MNKYERGKKNRYQPRNDPKHAAKVQATLLKAFTNKNKAATKIAAVFKGFKSRKGKATISNAMRPISNNITGTRSNFSDQNPTMLEAALYPESVHNIRMDSYYPTESSTFHKRFTIRSTTNATGNAAFVYTPNFVPAIGTSNTGLLINNAATLTLTGPEVTSGYSAIFMPYALPANTYSALRLVSCSIRILSNQSMLNATGILSGGIAFYPSQTDIYAAGNSYFPFNGDQTVASNVDALMFNKEANLVTGEELRLVYYIADPTYEAFIPVGTQKELLSNNSGTSFYFAGYIANATASSAFTLEIDVNFEALVYPTAKGFISVGLTNNSAHPGQTTHVMLKCEDCVSQVAVNLEAIIEKKKSTFKDDLISVGTTLGTMALKYIPQLFM